MLYLILVASCLFFSLFELNNKKIEKINKIPVVMILLIFMMNKTNFDYLNYVEIYKKVPIEIGSIEIGFIYFLTILKKIGFQYHMAPTLISILFVSVLFFGSNKNNDNSIIIFLYSIYYFIYDINQIRNLLMLIMIILGIKYGKKYFLFNLLGVFFHKFGLIYLVFGFFKMVNLKKYIKIIVVLFLVGLLMLPIIKFVSLKMFPEKLGYYYAVIPKFGFLIYYIMVSIDLFVIYFVQGYTNNTELQETYLKFFLFTIIFLPFSALSMEIMQRVYRNAFLIKNIFITQKLKKRSLIEKLVLFLVMIFNAALPLLVDLIGNFELVVNLLKSMG